MPPRFDLHLLRRCSACHALAFFLSNLPARRSMNRFIAKSF